jgi:hypothetical protein
MRLDRQAVAATSFVSLALIAIIVMASGTIFAASDTRDTRRPRAKPHTQQPTTQPAAASPQDRSRDDQAAPQAAPSAEKPVIAVPEKRPAATVIESKEVSGVLGKEVRSAADENMGRIVDVIVDQGGQTRAAIIDFGGFLGVGSRKIAVDWKALNFSPGQDRNRVVLQMTREQVTAAPEYQEGKPIFVLSAAAGTETVRFTTGSPGR